MKVLNRLTDRLLSALGIDMDFAIDLHGEQFNRVAPNLFVGARPSPADVQALTESGITHVVSCLEDTVRPEVEFLADAFHWQFIGLRDGMDQDIAPFFESFVASAEAAQKSGGSLLVHCQAGVSRSATLAIASVMHRKQSTFFAAFDEVRKGRPGVLPNIGFASQLQQLELSLIRSEATGPSSLARYLKQVCNVPASMDDVEQALVAHDFDAPSAVREIFGGEIPRVVQGVRR